MRFFLFLAIGCALSASITNSLQAQQVINVQSFEATTFPPTGWSAVSTSINRWGRATNSTFPTVTAAKFGNAFARYSARGVAANTIQTLALPAADYRLRGSNTPSVRFYMYRDSISKTGDSISVYVNTAASLSGAQCLGTVARYSRYAVPDTQIANGWYRYSFNIPAAYNGNANYIMIKAIGQAGYNIYLDSFWWDTYPMECSGKPSGASISSTTQNICGGSGTATLNLNGLVTTYTGLIYQWQNATSATGPWTNFGTGTTSVSTGLITATRYYRCVLTCMGSLLTDTTSVFAMNVLSTSRPNVAVLPGNANFCQGGAPVKLVAIGAKTYAWSPAAGLNTSTGDTVFASPTQNTTYLVIGTDTVGCSNAAQVQVFFRTAPVLGISAPDTLLCAGDSIRLQSTGNGLSTFSWTPGNATTSFFNAKPNVDTRYTLTAANTFGCSAQASINLYVRRQPVAKFGYSQNGNTFRFKDSAQNAKTWFWDFGDGNNSNRQNPTYTFSSDSLRNVTLVVCNPPCACDTKSMEINPKATGVNSLEQAAFRVFPNPAGNHLFVEGSASLNLILVTDLTGREFLRLKPEQQQKQHVLNLSALAPGHYLLRLQGNDHEQYTRIIRR
jgi:hypothetical protein